ncbi:MAG: 2-dehydropantoate 2-reductase [Elusimicrobia bacterium]|nr:2-dehydropantoate 2-reductase [Elusimicrobiota bacterium]
MERPQLAVIGPGAIGTWLAWRLSAVADVELVGRRPAWLSAARRGLVIRGAQPSGRRPRTARIRPTLSPSGRPAAVFVCVKSRDTKGALAHARRLAAAGTPVVSLQNGLAHVAPSVRALGAERAVFAACYAAVEREAPAQVRHHAGQTIWLGRTAANAASVAAARGFLKAAGLHVPRVAPEHRVLWTKLVFNAATNPIGALTGRTNGDLARLGALWEILLASLAEAEAAARADGHPPLVHDMAALLKRACRATPEQDNSMLQDLRAGRPTEIDAILGPILEAARRRRRPAPVLTALHRFVKRLEKELAA